LRLVGPVIDRGYAEAVRAAVAAFPFASCPGPVDHSEMAGLYRRSHVVLNTSRFEGGMANSLLEAMAWGRPVLASDVEGNRSLITDGVNGLLYRDEQEFVAKAEMLLSDTGLCLRLGTAGRDTVSRNHAPIDEAAKYLDLYRSIIGAK
jgi:glycosyltransferase involved in cell wall biosynthesis